MWKHEGGRVLKQGLCLVLFFSVLLSGCGERGRTIRQYRESGLEAMERGDYSAAAEAFHHAMDYYGTAKQEGTELDILRYLAEAEFRGGNYEQASDCYQELLERDGRRPEYLDLKSSCIVKAGGDLKEAGLLYQEATELLSSKKKGMPEYHLSALYTLGEALAKSRDPGLIEEAAAYYNEAQVSGGQSPELCARIGKLFFDSGDPERAETYFQEGLSLLEQQLPEVKEADRREEAMENRRELLFNVAVCAEYAGDYAGALKGFEDIAAEYGEDEALTHELIFLRSRVSTEGVE
ncbi:tetratricopeptide repeat protein [Fusobacterium naviforme]|uniref:Tetratricopeptide (TPR) repeat protein n=1 Tax=Moryella indoligenes TaxID=371674 RepID=A0AAE4ALA2_9FIRM|nr:tetratricopeptide repeat protein [Moryella indoligenes]MDQ0152935.1 tetratricopeptide (TPR) repeat protein [Moryella indoligenes]PSL09560.1 tetratricopeptide repeat protein [Fusobacterium naviforme]STO27448.1 Predicted ATPase [Fusobacterium naviforme]